MSSFVKKAFIKGRIGEAKSLESSPCRDVAGSEAKCKS